MSSQIASKNLYELLGNDPELDPDREPEPPTKVIDKPVQRAGKRNAGAEGPARDAPRPAGGGRGGYQQTFTRGDQAGSLNNRAENRDDGVRSDRHSNRTREPREFRGDGRGRGRGSRGRGGRGGAPRDDRHSHTGIGEHDKQAAKGWGAEDGNAEWADERAGDAIANAEAKNDAGFTPDTAGRDPAFSNGPDGETAAEDVSAEPEEKTKSYDEYIAELAEKRLALGGNLNVRKANEGSSQKFPEGKAFSRAEEDENFIAGSGGKAKKAKELQDKKERVTLDGQYYAAADSGERGGRGRGRGGRGGRGEFRGDRPRGGARGRGDSRGGARGDRGDRREPGGAPRGGINAKDETAFPALGA
ncbi:hypothetical protein AC579_6407 [Lecanosticta acicola]|uniref:Hyaluronan/mRNA-binding protein domain-containing protein n=1 Tax=Lecanosticta acicola TaxID=111012 RepID=A0AAI8Z076_9PEZI|nr:hypothetical protein AC579_6407 [Lecanosticta acicola]